MARSLSALLPVHNVQTTLTLAVYEFLEILPELTGQFELVIADDGSTDATIEVADELAIRYPQVSAVRHAARRGRAAAIRTALARSRGQIVLLVDDDCPAPLGEVQRLWQAVAEHEIVLGRAGPAAESQWLAWKRVDPVPSGGLQLIWRRAMEPLLGSLAHQTVLRATLTHGGYDWHEVELSRPGPFREPRRLSALAGQLLRRRSDRPGPTAATEPGQPGPQRPNYLAHLRDFALGE